MGSVANAVHREPWNKGKIVGQKAPFKLKDIWALRVRLQMENRVRELALFNLGIDSKLRGSAGAGDGLSGATAGSTRWCRGWSSCSSPSSGWMVAARSNGPTSQVGRVAPPSILGSARSMRLHYE